MADNMLIDGLIKFCDEKSKNIKLKAEPQVFIEIKQALEEFNDLKEKNVAKKPRFYAHNYYCAECDNLVGNNEFEWQRFLYCDKCGQKLDWQ